MLFDGPLRNSWRRPELTHLNRLAMRSPLVPFPDAEAAAAGDRSSSPWFRSLDGSWRFRLYHRPEDVPTSVVRPDYGDDRWSPIDVPGAWTRQGADGHAPEAAPTFDRPIYTNVLMPFAGEPPHVPYENPTGVYRTSFSLPQGWKSRRTVVSFGGAESVLYVWCNGSFVGMSTDSRLAAEFDLTDHVARGRNSLTAVVVRWGAATWLEDQDHWHHAGLHREVILRSVAHVSLADVAVATTADTLRAAVRLDHDRSLATGWSVRTRLTTERSRTVGDDTQDVPTPNLDFSLEGVVDAMVHPGSVTEHQIGPATVEPWSHERPTRHRLVTELLDPEGACVEAVAQWVGFTTVEIEDRRLLLNGQPVLIHGVNRHDHHPDTGKTQTPDELREDLVAIKRAGFNAVRTAHYPNDPQLLDLCDELGLWVLDEANIETHARQNSLCHEPTYTAAMTERIRRMVLRDRSHPCVMGWSLGNEAGYGAVHDAAGAWVRATDPSRYVHYEPASGTAMLGESGTGATATDVVCPMYASIDDIVAYAGRDDDRPLILCEYSHAMGNSNGSLADYWQAIEATEGLQGGFIWDWKDQGLRERDGDGREWFAYGGHHPPPDGGPDRHDGNFCINGIVGPENDPHPAVEEHRKLAEIVRVTAANLRQGRVRLTNRRWFRDLRDVRATWEVRVDGERIDGGPLDLPEMGPQKSTVVSVPFRRPDLRSGQRATLELSFRTRAASAWAPRNHELSWAQLDLPWSGRGTAPVVKVRRSVDVDVGDDGALRFDDLLVAGIEPCLWRAPVDNDGVRILWQDWGLDRLEATAEVNRRRGAWTVERTLRGAKDHATHRQRITPVDGGVELTEEIRIPEAWDDLPRVGVRLTVAGGHDRLTWLGAGPHETYPDRCKGARLGRWRSTVADQLHRYVRPQEQGAHVDTSWLTLTDGRGRGLRMEADEPFVFSALPHSVEALTAAETLAELPEVGPADPVYVHLDRAVRGVGTGACGPDTLPQYRVGPGRHRWSWRLLAV